MKRDLKGEIRAILRANPEGMTIGKLMTAASAWDHSVRKALDSMPDVYIAGWVKPRQGAAAAIYCAVAVPADCPRPAREKRAPQERKIKATPKGQGLTAIRGPWPTHA